MKIDNQPIVDRLNELIEQHGSRKAVAALLDIEVGHIDDLRNGRGEPGTRLLKAMGMHIVERAEIVKRAYVKMAV